MLYYLFDYLHECGVPGAGVFQYISFRAAAAIVISLFISMVVGKRLIRALARKQIGETVRDLGLAATSSSEATRGLLVLTSTIGTLPHTHTGRSGGQVHPCESSEKTCFTMRSSREW